MNASPGVTVCSYDTEESLVLGHMLSFLSGSYLWTSPHA